MKYSSPENLKKKLHHKTEEEKKIKANLNLMKLKAQKEIQEEKTIHYKTKYQEIDKELIIEIRELCPRTILYRTMGRKL